MHKYVKSDQIIDRLEKVTGLSRASIAREIFNISPSNLSNRIRENRIDLYKLIDWSINESINFASLIDGRSHEKEGEALAETQLSRLTKQFRNVHKAHEIIQSLLEIEGINPEALEKAQLYLKGVAEGLKMADYMGRRRGERRQNTEPYDADLDRRTGTDRRKAVGQ